MKSYRLSCGDSTQGPVGLCACVLADTKEEALAKLQHALENSTGALGEIRVQTGHEGVQYINVYISPENINVSEIEREGTYR